MTWAWFEFFLGALAVIAVGIFALILYTIFGSQNDPRSDADREDH